MDSTEIKIIDILMELKETSARIEQKLDDNVTKVEELDGQVKKLNDLKSKFFGAVGLITGIASLAALVKLFL